MTEDEIEFQKVVMEGLVPQMESSSICVSICPTEPNRIDAKFCVELGAMIMLDKPILAVVQTGSPVPKKLAMVADMILEADLMTSEGAALVAAAVQEMAESHG